jgi:tetratricopeptide (TPR) repeat protein
VPTTRAQETDRRDYAREVEGLTKVLEKQPNDFAARFNRGLCYESLCEYDKAIADYTKLIEDDTDFSRLGYSKEEALARTRHYRGRAYDWYKQDYAKAVADYTEALWLHPRLEEKVQYRRGRAHNLLAEYAKAETDFLAALERDPDYPNLQCAYAWQLATCPRPEFRNGTKALQLARKANEKFEGKVWDHMETLAAAYAEQNQFDEAVTCQKKAIELLGLKYPDYRKTMEARRKLYEKQQPYRAK